MKLLGPRAESVTAEGEPDGWVQPAGWYAEITPHGDTRLTVAGPHDRMPAIHAALVKALASPVSVLYRQRVNRQDPKPQGAPPRDFVMRDVPLERVVEAVESAAALLHTDARAEFWLQGAMGERLVLDEDGIVYIYPDDPAFRDALGAAGVEESPIDLVTARDYVKHWFRAECDAQEDGLIARLGLVEVPHRGGAE